MRLFSNFHFDFLILFMGYTYEVFKMRFFWFFFSWVYRLIALWLKNMAYVIWVLWDLVIFICLFGLVCPSLRFHAVNVELLMFYHYCLIFVTLSFLLYKFCEWFEKLQTYCFITSKSVYFVKTKTPYFITVAYPL